MPDPTQVKRALARLADGPPADETVLTEAERARTNLDVAARFVASGGVERLRRVVARSGDGRETLAAFERYREACQFRVGRPDADQFRAGHATDLPAEPKDTPD